MKKGRTFTYALDREHWVVGGPVNSGGDVFRWARDQILMEKSLLMKSLSLQQTFHQELTVCFSILTLVGNGHRFGMLMPEVHFLA